MTVFTNKGLEYDAKLFCGVSVAPFQYVALGSGTDAEAVGNTALTTELAANGLSRALGTGSYEADYIAVVEHTHTCTADGQTVWEVGLFDTAVTGGNMAIRKKFASVKNLDNGEKIKNTFKVTKARA